MPFSKNDVFGSCRLRFLHPEYRMRVTPLRTRERGRDHSYNPYPNNPNKLCNQSRTKGRAREGSSQSAATNEARNERGICDKEVHLPSVEIGNTLLSNVQ